MDKRIGNYSFIIGVVLALVLGLFSGFLPTTIVPWLASLLVVLGLIVGLMNVSGQKTGEFLLVATVLIVIAGVGTGAGAILKEVEILNIGTYLANVFVQLLAFIIPATVMVALKGVFALAQCDSVGCAPKAKIKGKAKKKKR